LIGCTLKSPDGLITQAWFAPFRSFSQTRTNHSDIPLRHIFAGASLRDSLMSLGSSLGVKPVNPSKHTPLTAPPLLSPRDFQSRGLTLPAPKRQRGHPASNAKKIREM
jgi:hypothetical protein